MYYRNEAGYNTKEKDQKKNTSGLFLFDGHVIKLGEHEIPTGTPYTLITYTRR